MALTHEQKLTLRTHIQANTTQLPFSGGTAAINTVFAGGSLGAGDAQLIAQHYNADASPDYHIYRTRVPMSEIMLNGFNWTRVDNLSVGKSRIWEWMFDAGNQSIDPSKSNIRAGINAVWVGTQPDLDVRAAVYAHCHRLASRVEHVLRVNQTGDGTPPAVDGSGPGLTTYDGAELTADSIQDIHGLPA